MSATDMIWAVVGGFACWLVSMLLLLYAKTMFSKSTTKDPFDIVIFRVGVVGLYSGVLIFWRAFYFAPPSILPEATWIRYGSYGLLAMFGLFFVWLAQQVWKTSYTTSQRNNVARKATARS